MCSTIERDGLQVIAYLIHSLDDPPLNGRHLVSRQQTELTHDLSRNVLRQQVLVSAYTVSKQTSDQVG